MILIKYLIVFFLALCPALAGSPFLTGAAMDIPITMLGGTAFLWAGYNESKSQPLDPALIASLDKSSLNILDRSATDNWSPAAAKISDCLLAGICVAPFIASLNEGMKGDICVIALMQSENLILAGGITSLTKSWVQRVRPFVYNPAAPMEQKMKADARRSFFSGHTSLSFASAAFLTRIYSEYHPKSQYTVGVLSYGTAAFIGFLRYEAGKHFPTDIITGAVAGTAIGLLIPEIHRNRDKSSRSIVPVPFYPAVFSLHL